MPTIALRVPTVMPGVDTLPGGHCYILFGKPESITVRELIAEKVRAELRKARAGGESNSSLVSLLRRKAPYGHGPLDEQLAIKHAYDAFTNCLYNITVNGRTLTNLDEEIKLTKRSVVLFIAYGEVTA